MAGAGYKLFNTGDVLTAQQVNEYLQQQTVMVFADASARTTALSGVLAEGMVSYLKDTNSLEVYNGSAWIGSGSPLTTKGDLYTYSTTNARLGVGTNGQVLKANSATATGLEWGAASTSFNSAYAFLSTLQTTSSTSYTDLATVTSVTLTTGTKALVSISASAEAYGGWYTYVSFAVSGATTIAAADEWALYNFANSGDEKSKASNVHLVTGLTAGSNTFTMKFKSASGGAREFINRSITVIDMGS